MFHHRLSSGRSARSLMRNSRTVRRRTSYSYILTPAIRDASNQSQAMHANTLRPARCQRDNPPSNRCGLRQSLPGHRQNLRRAQRTASFFLRSASSAARSGRSCHQEFQLSIKPTTVHSSSCSEIVRPLWLARLAQASHKRRGTGWYCSTALEVFHLFFSSLPSILEEDEGNFHRFPKLRILSVPEILGSHSLPRLRSVFFRSFA